MGKSVKRLLTVVLATVLVILLSVGTTFIVNKSNKKAVSATVKDGMSAYDLAKAYGYSGTVTEWLASLNGKSAYELAKESGYSGTEKEFSDAVAANASAPAVGIKSAAFSSAGELIITLSDGKSINLGKAVGKDGMNGKNGSDGKDGTN